MYDTYTCEELQELLNDALNALHLLRTGRSPRVVVDQNGERVEFTAANQGYLVTYINQLRSTMANKGCSNGTCSVQPAVARPLEFFF